MKPTIGRQVHYYPGLYPMFPCNDPKIPMAATVSFVHSPKMLNLCVIDHDGNPRSVTSVPFVGDDDVQHAVGAYCIAPPRP